MHTQNFISDAVKGGYKIDDFFYGRNAYYPHSVLLDPQAWIAVGNTRGWGINKIDGKVWKTGRDGYINVWQSYQHDFIDHLASGKDIESALGLIS
jgi:hypothetical protein